MKDRLNIFANLGLRSKLVVMYIILITIPLCIISFRFYTASKEIVSDVAKRNVYEIVKKNNEIVDTKLSQVQENIIAFNVDKDLYNGFSDFNPEIDYNIVLLDNEISKVLNKYFSQSKDIYSVQLATSYFTFGPSKSSNSESGKNFIPANEFLETDLYKIAKEKNGKIQWVPTYEFSEMFHLPYMRQANTDYRYLFSAVEMINGAYFDGNIYTNFKEGIEKPVLIVNFKESFFQKIFSQSIPIEGSFFFIADNKGSIISHQDPSKLATLADYPWLPRIILQKSGTDRVEIDGVENIICFDTIKGTGWISVVVLPPQGLINKILPAIKSFIIYSVSILILVSLFTAFFITGRITKPIQKLTKAMKMIGSGNFDVKIAEEGSREFKLLINRFNGMNDKIQKLIEENYEIKIREREAEIRALNLQLDPHFMYNTLNLINLISVENEQDEVSEMIVSLSTMLRYTSKNKKFLVPFKEDMEYLKSYILIMTKRFEGKFTVEYNIDPESAFQEVPKFFLQPFVENTFVHGFESLNRKGLLKISCWMDENSRWFIVEDNGKGINKDQLSNIMNSEKGSIGIQNVDQRIKIIYGDDYGVLIESEIQVGTKITIKLPLTIL
ncbi:MAG TPA: sensor histidine kinase [Bacilli bacterium]